MLLVADLANTKLCKKTLKNDWNPGTWVLIWEYSARAILWVPTWQGLDGLQQSLHPCAFDESSFSVGSVNPLRAVAQESQIILVVSFKAYLQILLKEMQMEVRPIL